MRKTILVTGGAGFIGSTFVYMLFEEHPGWKVVCVDSLTYAANIHTLTEAFKNPRFVFYKEDIRNREGVFSIFEKEHPDIVVNFAAESHVDRSLSAPMVFAQSNTIGTVTLLEEARKYWVKTGGLKGHRFYYFSTDEVFGFLDKDGESFSETTPVYKAIPS